MRWPWLPCLLLLCGPCAAQVRSTVEDPQATVSSSAYFIGATGETVLIGDTQPATRGFNGNLNVVELTPAPRGKPLEPSPGPYLSTLDPGKGEHTPEQLVVDHAPR